MLPMLWQLLVSGAGLKVSRVNILKHRFVETQICDEFLKSCVFFFKFFEFAYLIGFEAAVFFSPSIIRLDCNAKFLGD